MKSDERPVSALQEAHKGMEVMSAAIALIKQEQWGEAERALDEAQAQLAKVLKLVGDKGRANLHAPKPDDGDRG